MELFHATTTGVFMMIRTVIAVVALATGAGVFAQTPPPAGPKDPLATPRIDQRQANQEKRMEQGAASGQLTEREQRRLKLREERIANVEARAKADGNVTGKERKQLVRMEDRESKDIHREKHDQQRDMNHDGQRDHKAGGEGGSRAGGSKK
jgi:hypothetical protein